MDLTTLSDVRHRDEDAHRLLSEYIYGGLYTPPLVPRGIAHQDVSNYILANLKLNDSVTAYRNTLEVMKFYEKGEVLDILLRVIKQEIHTAEDVARAAYVLQATAEFSAGEIVERANKYFDDVLVTHSQALDVLPILLETKVVLAPIGNLDKLASRINTEVKKAESAVSNENTMAYYDKLSAIQRNNLPRTQHRLQRKVEILAMDKPQQQSELIAVYLGQADISDFYSEIWAARRLRFDHINDISLPIISQLSKVLQNTQIEDPIGSFIYERSARAIIYLEAELSIEQQQKFDAMEKAGAHFLSDSVTI
ncbi:hypothetical protein [uncultured Paraglaciecola sp.]|uniref:hypothetical protein n=1 Tax=uncultured Paraglaciecola sp. TaxID=1765024 RepID=UPI0030D9DBF6|tara:strand:- start:18265 stop:19191 length:927 start_codon:yes stop_codon:yes gene_type:complete